MHLFPFQVEPAEQNLGQEISTPWRPFRVNTPLAVQNVEARWKVCSYMCVLLVTIHSGQTLNFFQVYKVTILRWKDSTPW